MQLVRPASNMLALCVLLLCLALLPSAYSVLPAGQLLLRDGDRDVALHFAPGSLSKAHLPEMHDAEFQRLLLPSNGETGCGSTIVVPAYSEPFLGFSVLLERGDCSYRQKALAAQKAGASSVLVANTVRGVYGDRGHAKSSDVNCEAGSGWLNETEVLSPPYLPDMVDRMPKQCTQDARCASKQCLLTNTTDASRPGQVRTCCAWDLWQDVGLSAADLLTDAQEVAIPVGFLRMADTERLLREPALGRAELDVLLCARDTSWSWASFLCWWMAVTTVGCAAWRAAKQERVQWYNQAPRNVEGAGGGRQEREGVQRGESTDESQSVGSVPSVRPLHSRKRRDKEGKERQSARTAAPDESVRLLGSEGGIEHGYGTSPAGRSLNNRGNDSALGIDSRRMGSTDSDGGGDDHSLTSSASEYYLRVKGKFVHSAVQEQEQAAAGGEEDEELTPKMVGLGILLMSCVLLFFYFVNVYWVLTTIFMCLAALAIHVLFLEGPVLLLVCMLQDVGQRCQAHCCSCCGGGEEERGREKQADRDLPGMEESDFAYAETDALVGRCDEYGGDKGQGGGEGRDAGGASASQVLKSMLRKLCTIGNVSNCVCFLCAVSLPLLWLFHRHASYAWVLQDIFGMCLVTLFLTQMKLGNLSTLTTLLGCAFCYDVFFVFIEPLLFGGESIMASVAGQHANTAPLAHPEQADGNYCDKYPHESVCRPDQIPMMLVVPPILTWNTYNSQILGLGDLLLPGLLVVWAARLDMRTYGTLSSEQAGGGFFPQALSCYAAGLCLANTAVQYFDVGQPALLYIVPCTLLPILQRTYAEGTLGALWRDLPPMRTVALTVDEAKLQEYMRREEVIRATATWPPDVEQERRIVSLDASKTAVAALPRPQSGQSKQSLYKSVFHGMQAGAGGAAGGGGQ